MLKLVIQHDQPKSDPNDKDSGVLMILCNQNSLNRKGKNICLAWIFIE